jgi:hypothetical protein
MSRYIREIINPELFFAKPDHTAGEVLGHLLGLGISAAPVTEADSFPLGIVTVRDLVGASATDLVSDYMSSPPLVVDTSAPVALAARLMSEAGLHHLLVVDSEARLAGIVSAVDVMRALIGLAPRFPAAFPHYDARTGVSWSDLEEFTLDKILEQSPSAPGVISLVRGGVNYPETVVWCELTEDISLRLVDLVSGPQAEPLPQIVSLPNLRFRYAVVRDVEQRLRVLREVEHQQHQAAIRAR